MEIEDMEYSEHGDNNSRTFNNSIYLVENYYSDNNCRKYKHLGFSFFNLSIAKEDKGISEPYRELVIMKEPNETFIITKETIAVIFIISKWSSMQIREWVTFIFLF